MKTQVKLAAAPLLVIMFATFYVASVSTVFAQGSLTPPGAPAPTMKTLAQIEPRTPISSAPCTISQPGSYYLTTNLTVSSGTGIYISADDVTLDLNGFTIRSTAPSSTGYGIYLSGTRRNIAIANGFIVGGVTNNGSGVFSGSGFNYGIYESGDRNVKVSNVSLAGCQYYGIRLQGETCVVEGCTVTTVGSYGINAGTVRSSVAEDCGATAITGNQINNCCGASVGGYGISGNTVLNSYGYSRRTSGSWAVGIMGDTVENCYGYATNNSDYAYGINGDTVENCYGYGRNDSGYAYGISGTSVHNSRGYGQNDTSYARGISAITVQGSYGGSLGNGSQTTYGINANTVHNSYGYCSGSDAAAGIAIYAAAVGNCYAYSTRSNTASRGIKAYGPVDTCYAICSYGTALEASSANNCLGSTTSGTFGLYVYRSAKDCYGITESGTSGLRATTAENCYGYNTSGTYGLYATSAGNCYGYNNSGTYGLYAHRSAADCYGYNEDGTYGLRATTALNCCGVSGGWYGLYADTAENCYGESGGFNGLYAVRNALNCVGFNYGYYVGLWAAVAQNCYGIHDGPCDADAFNCGIHGIILNSCIGANVVGALKVEAQYKYNMP